MSTFYSNGKLLLTSEYLVLNGALALAVPTKYGQRLTVKEIDEPKLIWKSFDENGAIWHKDLFTIDEITTNYQHVDVSSIDTSKRLLQILNCAKTLNPNFLSKGYQITTSLSFPRKWGLGTSSTLINNIAKWATVDAYKLLALTFGGSGYDIACAQNNKPITYQLNKESREVKQVNFNPTFRENLYFVYLNKKQDSQKEVKAYKSKVISHEIIQEATHLTKSFLTSTSLSEFCELIEKHEQLLSSVLEVSPIKERLFSDFNGAVKSLGAWGGDFVLVTSKENPESYFKGKGFKTIIPYNEMVFN